MQAAEEPIETRSRERTIRVAAALYLIGVVTGIFGFFVPQSLIVPMDAVATAHRILASETLLRLALVSGLVASVVFIFLVWELYRLLNGVDRSLASLMVVLLLLSVPISFIDTLTQVAALRLVRGGPELSGLGSSQSQALAMFFFRLSGDLSGLNSVFFGLWLLPFGLLAIRSGFIPRIVGYLLLVAAVSYLAGSLNFLLSPPFAPTVSRVATVGYLGELAAVAWLVARAIRSRSSAGNLS